MVRMENWDDVKKWLNTAPLDPSWSYIAMYERRADGSESPLGRWDRPVGGDPYEDSFLAGQIESWVEEQVHSNAPGLLRGIFRVRFMGDKGHASRMGSKTIVVQDDVTAATGQPPEITRAAAEARTEARIFDQVERFLTSVISWTEAVTKSFVDVSGVVSAEAKDARSVNSTLLRQIEESRREDQGQKMLGELNRREMELREQTITKGMDKLGELFSVIANGSPIPKELQPLAELLQKDAQLREALKEPTLLAALRQPEIRDSIISALRKASDKEDAAEPTTTTGDAAVNDGPTVREI